MSREQLLDMARHEIENLGANRIDLAPDIYRVPAELYIDRDRWELEVDRIFRRLPLMLAFSSELREPNSYRALEVMNTPVLITRAEDGQIRAFVNMCSHRGAVVAGEGCGTAKGFRCPYHAWSYDTHGKLVSVFDNKNFGEVDKGANGLTPLQVAERAGMIFVTLNPQSDVDIDDFLAGYDAVLAEIGFDKCHVVGRQTLSGPNWKVAYDGYRDLYHLPILHKNTFGPDSPFQADYYPFGPHARVIAPRRYEKLADLPEEQWRNEDLTTGVWTIFPNISIAGGNGGVHMVSQMFPGSSPTESLTIQNFLLPGDPADDNHEEIAGRMAFYDNVVQNEDYFTGRGIQKALATGAKSHLMFGRNEGGGQMFHRWVEALVNTDDADLPALLKTGVSL